MHTGNEWDLFQEVNILKVATPSTDDPDIGFSNSNEQQNDEIVVDKSGIFIVTLWLYNVNILTNYLL